MPKTRYRRGNEYARTIRELLQLAVHPEHDPTLDHYKLALVCAIRERLTPRELMCMSHYYGSGYTLPEIASRMELQTSTISRNIRRGEGKLDSLIQLADEISPVKFGRA